jgi:glucosyl-3-phosphoglycerate synthase
VTALFKHSPSISLCLPARNERGTIASALDPLLKLLRAGAVEQLVVVDDSSDGTSTLARRMGVEVYDQAALMPEFGSVLGKGDAMWRSLSVLTGEIIVWLDADCTSVTPGYVSGLADPISAGRADLVKARYRRPLGDDPNGGGRVNHLLARPLLRRLFPHIGALRQPLSGETAITRELAWSLPFVCGYGVELGLLIDAADRGSRIEEVDLGVHLHRHRPLDELSWMAGEILDVALARAYGDRDEAPVSRPAMRSVLPSANDGLVLRAQGM